MQYAAIARGAAGKSQGANSPRCRLHLTKCSAGGNARSDLQGLQCTLVRKARFHVRPFVKWGTRRQVLFRRQESGPCQYEIPPLKAGLDNDSGASLRCRDRKGAQVVPDPGSEHVRWNRQAAANRLQASLLSCPAGQECRVSFLSGDQPQSFALCGANDLRYADDPDHIYNYWNDAFARLKGGKA